MQFTLSAAAAFALFTSANAHLFISEPTPMNGNAIKNPLDPSGSDFPCHGVALGSGDATSMSVGSKQNLVFDNGDGANWAVHGGGSCQISITYETDPVKVKDPNNWRVLYSIESGCPTNSPLNLNGNYVSSSGVPYTGAWQCSDPKTNGYDCVNAFQFPIPDGVKNGKATLAWTWFNNVGNREMYMNCVNVNFSGGKSDDSGLSQFPAMFVANLASINPTCTTSEQSNVGFPNPGQNVLVNSVAPAVKAKVASAKDYPIVTNSNCPVGGKYIAPTGAQSSAAAQTPSAAAPSTSAAAVTSAPAAPSAPVVSSAPAAAAPSPAQPPKKGGKDTTIKKRPAAATPSAAAKPAPTGTGAVSLPAPAATQGSCANGSVACTGVNSIICVDLNHFGICDYNGCAISQAVAPGTECSSGAITWARKSKRHFSRHLRNAHKA